MSDPLRFGVGDVTLTRVPYFDVSVPAAIVGLTASQVLGVEWAVPTWADPDGQVRVGQCVWVVESGDRVLVVDPCGAADQFIRSGPEAIVHQDAVLGAMELAGVAVGRVDTVVLTHLDGIGLAGVVDDAGQWSPAFPNARIVLSEAELAWLAGAPWVGGLGPLTRLMEQGAVDGIAGGALAPGVTLVHTGGHTPGHAILRVHSGGEAAILLGHLALNPVNTASALPQPAQDDPARAAEVLGGLLADAAGSGAILVGSLWPAPGAGRVGAEGAIIPAVAD